MEGYLVVRRSWTSHLLSRVALAFVLFASACSGSPSAPPTPSAATSAPATALPKPTPEQQTGTPAEAVNPAAQPAGQPEQRSVQAGGDPGGPVSDAPAAPVVARSRTTGRPITLEVWLTDWEQTTQQLFNEQLVPAFEAANQDIAVNVQYLDWRVFTEKLIAAHAGGVLPDIYQAGAEYVAPLATKGMALNIDNYVANWGQKDDFYESAWSTVTYQGKTYGVPVLSAPQTLMYRKDMLQQAGVSGGPATWVGVIGGTSTVTDIRSMRATLEPRSSASSSRSADGDRHASEKR